MILYHNTSFLHSHTFFLLRMVKRTYSCFVLHAKSSFMEIRTAPLAAKKYRNGCITLASFGIHNAITKQLIFKPIHNKSKPLFLKKQKLKQFHELRNKQISTQYQIVSSILIYQYRIFANSKKSLIVLLYVNQIDM